MQDIKTIQHYLSEHIPITQALGIKVELLSDNEVIVSAPLDHNINHKKTVFGGSLTVY
ncbi:MAG: YiiD C-terminal domain-containing protein [Candidatus Berkiella sp.]